MGLEFPISGDSYFSDIWGTKLLITPLLAIALLTILTNLILTGFFVVLVKHLALKAESEKN